MLNVVSRLLRILLVDDNPDDRGLVERELRKEFPNVQILEAIDQAQLDGCIEKGGFDLVVTDYHLLWSDGITSAESRQALLAALPGDHVHRDGHSRNRCRSDETRAGRLHHQNHSPPGPIAWGRASRIGTRDDAKTRR